MKHPWKAYTFFVASMFNVTRFKVCRALGLYFLEIQFTHLFLFFFPNRPMSSSVHVHFEGKTIQCWCQFTRVRYMSATVPYKSKNTP